MPNRENIATGTSADDKTSAWEGWVFIGICVFGFAATVFVISLSSVDLPPLKWSSVKYYFRMEDKIDGQEEAYG
jgi:hypothetical protein